MLPLFREIPVYIIFDSADYKISYYVGFLQQPRGDRLRSRGVTANSYICSRVKQESEFTLFHCGKVLVEQKKSDLKRGGGGVEKF